MQNSTKFFLVCLVCATMIFFCADYRSIFAQDGQKAFNEGDMVLTIGLSNGMIGALAGGIPNHTYRNTLTPSVTFDYGVKGTRGIFSIGGFASFSKDKLVGYDEHNYLGGTSGIYNLGSDGLYTISKREDVNTSVFTVGVRFGLHYSTRKWDLYGGLMIGDRTTISEGGKWSTERYEGTPQNPYNKLVKTDETDLFNRKSSTFFVSPYAGARYYVTKKVSLNLEVGQYTGNVGLGFKF